MGDPVGKALAVRTSVRIPRAQVKSRQVWQPLQSLLRKQRQDPEASWVARLARIGKLLVQVRDPASRKKA